MKKRVKQTIITATILLMLTIQSVCYNRLPNFRVYNSFVLMTSEGRKTEINVIVYKNRSEELYREIETEHNRVNGEPKTLTINLYNKDKEIKKGVAPYAVIFIDYSENIYEIYEDANAFQMNRLFP